MNAYEIMHEWDRATGKPERTDDELDRDIPPLLGGGDYETWKAALEAKKVSAIKQGMTVWGLPIEPLPGFEVDDAIATYERGMDIQGPNGSKPAE